MTYRLYTLDADGPRCIAECPTPESIGTALVTIADDNREAGLPCEVIGVLSPERRWLTSLWTGRKAVFN